MTTVETLQKWTNGRLIKSENVTSTISELATDSRSIQLPQQAVFIAINTHNRNGHTFLKDAYEKGVRTFIVSEETHLEDLKSINAILVKNTLIALQQIATNHRKLFKIPTIGITGSNGKTIVKEWLYQILGSSFNIVRSPKSYNSQIGVPLSVWQIEAEHELGIFEAGISQPGEMEQLSKIINPSIGIFTNIGEAHSEGFMNNRQKINEKLVLFRNAEHLIYCKDHAELNQTIVSYLGNINSGRSTDKLIPFTWSTRQEANLRIQKIEKQQALTTIEAIYNDSNISISIPFTDDASIENAIHCWCAGLLLNVKQEVLAEQFHHLQQVSMRMELRHGINDCTIINDSYNSDITSLQFALNYLEQQKQHHLHTVILSDMLQIGKQDMELYEDVADMLAKRNIQRFIGIGPALFKNKSTFRKHKKIRSIFFKTTKDFLQQIHLLTFNKEAILLKGARIFKFEQIAALLEQQVHQTVMNINLGALKHNFNVYKSVLSPGTKMMVMVKAFAYGSGSYEIANVLQQAGADYLTVAYTDEGIALRRASIALPIMVMSPDATSFDRMIAWKLEPEIFNFRSLQLFLQMAETMDVEHYPIHIKLETGMHRLGFDQKDLNELISVITTTKRVKIASIFSHLAASDDPAQDSYTKEQAERFNKMSHMILKALNYKPILHLSNSAAIVRHRDLQYDMVRLGIGLYGTDSSKELNEKLQTISTLKTVIAQIKELEPGENIGYGHHTIASAPMRTATISIGYADGYYRALGKGNAYVLIHGKEARTVGSICMDMCMVDITHIPEAKEGDEVIIFGKDLAVGKVASWAGTISYELMTNISQRVKRIYINEE